jgi:hypothetical protein
LVGSLLSLFDLSFNLAVLFLRFSGRLLNFTLDLLGFIAG